MKWCLGITKEAYESATICLCVTTNSHSMLTICSMPHLSSIRWESQDSKFLQVMELESLGLLLSSLFICRSSSSMKNGMTSKVYACLSKLSIKANRNQTCKLQQELLVKTKVFKLFTMQNGAKKMELLIPMLKEKAKAKEMTQVMVGSQSLNERWPFLQMTGRQGCKSSEKKLRELRYKGWQSRSSTYSKCKDKSILRLRESERFKLSSSISWFEDKLRLQKLRHQENTFLSN